MIIDNIDITTKSTSYDKFIEKTGDNIVSYSKENNIPLENILKDIDVYASKEIQKAKFFAVFVKGVMGELKVQTLIMSLKRQEPGFMVCLQHKEDTLAFIFNNRKSAFSFSIISRLVTKKETSNAIEFEIKPEKS